MSTLRRSYGVTYLLVDKTLGGATAKLSRLGRLVFSNRAVSIYAVKPADG
jgi:hypothetical protein